MDNSIINLVQGIHLNDLKNLHSQNLLSYHSDESCSKSCHGHNSFCISNFQLAQHKIEKEFCYCGGPESNLFGDYCQHQPSIAISVRETIEEKPIECTAIIIGFVVSLFVAYHIGRHRGSLKQRRIFDHGPIKQKSLNLGTKPTTIQVTHELSNFDATSSAPDGLNKPLVIKPPPTLKIPHIIQASHSHENINLLNDPTNRKNKRASLGARSRSADSRSSNHEVSKSHLMLNENYVQKNSVVEMV